MIFQLLGDGSIDFRLWDMERLPKFFLNNGKELHMCGFNDAGQFFYFL